MAALVGHTLAWKPREVLGNAKVSKTVWKGGGTPHKLPRAHHVTVREGQAPDSEIHSRAHVAHAEMHGDRKVAWLVAVKNGMMVFLDQDWTSKEADKSSEEAAVGRGGG